MQLATQLAQIMESGKVTMYTDSVKDFEVKVENKEIDINATNKKFVKEMISSMQNNPDQNERTKKRKTSEARKIRNLLDMFRVIAEELFDVGITVTLSYKGDKLITMGEKARPKLSHFLTGKAIEVNNLIRLIEVAI